MDPNRIHLTLGNIIIIGGVSILSTMAVMAATHYLSNRNVPVLSPLSSGGSLGSPVSSHTEIPAIPTPIPALVGAGAILNRFNITNPLESITPTATYTPSASDIMSTQPGGISRVLLAVPNAPPGASYTVDTNSQLGSGPPVAVSQRIAGERYDAYGRVIL